MKKKAREILVLSVLGVWGFIAIASGQPHSHKCNAEWKIALKHDVQEVSTSLPRPLITETESKLESEIQSPGFMSLIFQ